MNNHPAVVLGVVLRHLNTGQLDLVVGHLVPYLYVTVQTSRMGKTQSLLWQSRGGVDLKLESSSASQGKCEKKEETDATPL